MVERTHTVSIDDLDDSMVIQAYMGFGSLYTPTTLKSCRWLIHNFKGAKVFIARGEKKGSIAIEKMRPGDTVLKIYELPKGLSKLTVVTPRLVTELRSRGFKRFLIAEHVSSLNRSGQKKAESVAQVNELVANVAANVPVHHEAAGAVEELLDSARSGRINTTEVLRYVNRICEESTGAAFSAMVSLQESDQTYAHCVDVATIFQQSYADILRISTHKSIFRDEKELMLAGFLHDFGKSKVPKEILDSTQRFERESKEMHLMQSHPTFGAELLTQMGLPAHVVNMAHYHHVKMDPGMKNSYPPVEYKQVIFETKLLALVDIYQALVGKRSYKKSWTPPETIRYLGTLSGVEFEDASYDLFVNVLGKYPKSSLVKLSDERVGFVVNVPDDKTQLDRPQVAVTTTASGEQLSHNDLVDLMEERDISIVTELDAQDVFGEHALDVFCQLNVS